MIGIVGRAADVYQQQAWINMIQEATIEIEYEVL